MESLFTILKLICFISLTMIFASIAIIVFLTTIDTIKDHVEEIIRDWKYNERIIVYHY